MPPLTEPAGYRVEPSGWIGAPLELVPLPESLQQCVLNEVLRFVRTSAHPHANTKETRSHPFRNIREGHVATLLLSHTPKGHSVLAVFLNKKKVAIIKGDTLVIVGSRVAVDDERVFMAKEVKKGDSVWTLRDAAGLLLWRGRGGQP
jgi:hypothetical protein